MSYVDLLTGPADWFSKFTEVPQLPQDSVLYMDDRMPSTEE